MELISGILILTSLSMVLGCGGSEQSLDSSRAYTDVALTFAKALASSQFDKAYSLLSPEMRQQYSPETLRANYQQMFAYAGKTSATGVEVMNVMEDFPDKTNTDLGWVYVSITGPDEQGGSWGEAVAVVVTKVDGELLIRDITWGRP